MNSARLVLSASLPLSARAHRNGLLVENVVLRDDDVLCRRREGELFHLIEGIDHPLCSYAVVWVERNGERCSLNLPSLVQVLQVGASEAADCARVLRPLVVVAACDSDDELDVGPCPAKRRKRRSEFAARLTVRSYEDDESAPILG
jgi:hypothetical protein